MEQRVLIAETDNRLRRLYQKLLRRYGYAVTVAGSEAECVAALRTTRPDLLVLDQRCCSEDGTAIRDALWGDPPVVITVPVAGRVNWPLLTSPEVVDVLYTPAAPSEVLDCVRAALAGEVRLDRKMKVTYGDCWAAYTLILSPSAPVPPRPVRCGSTADPARRTAGRHHLRSHFPCAGRSMPDGVATAAPLTITSIEG